MVTVVALLLGSIVITIGFCSLQHRLDIAADRRK